MPDQDKAIPNTEKGSDRDLRAKQAAVDAAREQKAAIDTGTPGGGLGVSDEKELKEDPASTSEKGADR